MVEFAPYQKLPLEKKKVDSRNATIEQGMLQSSRCPSRLTIRIRRRIHRFSAVPGGSFNQASRCRPALGDARFALRIYFYAYFSLHTDTHLVASTERPAMPASTPLLDALKAEKSAQRDKEAIQRNHPHYKDAVQASKREESKKKTAATSSTAAESKKSGESTAPLGKRAAKRAAAAAAAAQKASAQAGPAAQPKSGNAPSEAKPPSSSPSKGKSARAGKHHSKPPPFTSPSQVAPVPAATAPSSPPTEASAQPPTPAPGTPIAPALTPTSSDNPGRRTRPVLGIASRHFEAALSGAGVSKGSGSGRRERGAEREREKEPAKDGSSSREKRDGGGRRKKEDDALQRAGSGTAPAAPQPGVLPALTILQREPKNTPPRPSHQASSTDPTSGAAATPDSTNHPTPIRGSGKRGRGRGRGRGGDRSAPPPPPSALVDP